MNKGNIINNDWTKERTRQTTKLIINNEINKETSQGKSDRDFHCFIA